MTDTAQLVLAYHWFDMIDRGDKRIEYRDATDYWRKRLEGKTKVCFHRGYTKVTMTFEIAEIKEFFGVFRIYLGQRLPRLNISIQKRLG